MSDWTKEIIDSDEQYTKGDVAFIKSNGLLMWALPDDKVVRDFPDHVKTVEQCLEYLDGFISERAGVQEAC